VKRLDTHRTDLFNIATSLVLPPQSNMDQSTTLSNGHSSPSPNESIRQDPPYSDTESDLSDPVDPPVPSASPAPPRQLQNGDNNERSSTIEQEEAIQSDDADYDMDTSMQRSEPTRYSRSPSSDDSIRPAKRKAPMDEEEDYIRNNPDLYGLRHLRLACDWSRKCLACGKGCFDGRMAE
jgi:hypothetical protein